MNVGPMGIGTWAWGDRMYWGRNALADARDAFDASMAAGIRFFDTAEVYGFGRSEELLGQFLRDSPSQDVIVATKFFPSFPWRLRKRSLLAAANASLGRLGIKQIDLYQIHNPRSPRSIDTWVSAMADAVEAGLVKLVGVSNYSVEQTRRAHQILAQRNLPLTSNQVNYSLLERGPERSGLLQTCRELGVTLIAYSPLAQGVLTGKYTPEHPAPGVRRFRYGRSLLQRAQSVVSLLREIGEGHEGKSPAQVAINWTICKGTLPIPGVRNRRQAEQAIGALGWTLTADEVEALDAASDRFLAQA